MCTKPDCDAVLAFPLSYGLGNLVVRCGQLTPEQRALYGCGGRLAQAARLIGAFPPPRITRKALLAVCDALDHLERGGDLGALGLGWKIPPAAFAPAAQVLLERVIELLERHDLFEEASDVLTAQQPAVDQALGQQPNKD